MFPLASQLARNVSVDLKDSLRTKTALNNLGYLNTPSFGLTEYPNETRLSATAALLERGVRGITKFQNDNGLKVDGIALM